MRGEPPEVQDARYPGPNWGAGSVCEVAKNVKIREQDAATPTASCGERRERPCKPDPVLPTSRERRPFLWDRARARPRTVYPEGAVRRSTRSFPIWPFSEWGLPCRTCHQVRGALLPHRFTLARPASLESAPDVGGLFSVALSLASRPVAVGNHPDLWSPDFPPRSPGGRCGAAARASHAAGIVRCARERRRAERLPLETVPPRLRLHVSPVRRA